MEVIGEIKIEEGKLQRPKKWYHLVGNNIIVFIVGFVYFTFKQMRKWKNLPHSVHHSYDFHYHQKRTPSKDIF